MFRNLVGVEDFVAPALFEGDVGGKPPLVGGVFIREEVAREPSHLILRHGNLEIPFAEAVTCGIKSHNGQDDISFFLMQEGVEVKDLILLARLHLSSDNLSGVGDSETSEGAKMPATTFVLELHLRHAFWYRIGNDEATKCDDTVEGSGNGLLLVGNGQGCIIKICVGVAYGVVELNL